MDKYYQFEEYAPVAALVIAMLMSLSLFKKERKRDLDRMLEYQFRDEDRQRMAEYERQFELQLEGI